MSGIEIVLGIILLILAAVLIVAVLMQSGKDKNLSGVIAGGADTFFNKSRAGAWDKILEKATGIIAAVFAVVVLILYFVCGK